MGWKEDRILSVHSRGGGGRRLALLVAPLAALLAFAAPAGAAPFAYVTNGLSSFVSQYEAAGGALTPLSPTTVSTTNDAGLVAISPDGQSAYVTTGYPEATVLQYSIGTAGRLTLKSSAALPTPALPGALAVSPDGGSAYVINNAGDGSVIQYSVGASGALTLKSTPSVPTGPAPARIAVAPNGQSVYVTNADNTLSQYSAGLNGALHPKSPPTVATGEGPVGVAVSPDGRSAYVANSVSLNSLPGTVSQYTVGADGALSPKSPPEVLAGRNPFELAIGPNGRAAYVTDSDAPGSVLQFTIGPTGVLTPKSPTAVPARADPLGLAINPDGQSVYAVNGNGDNVSQYDVGANGALSPKSPATVAAGDNPLGVAVSPVVNVQPKPGWEGFVTNPTTGCRARVQVPYLEGGRRVTAYTEVFCPRTTQLTIRSRLRSDYPTADVTVDQKGCISGCRYDVGTAHRFFRLTCSESAPRRHHQRYYSDIVLFPGANAAAATTERSRDKLLSPLCAQ